MKIELGKYKTRTIENLCNGIIMLDYEKRLSELYEIQLKLLTEFEAEEENPNEITFLIKRYDSKNFKLPLIEVYRLNLLHVLKADIYFTNGQTILSAVKNSKGEFETFIHKPINTFWQYQSERTIATNFSISTDKPIICKSIEKLKQKAVSLLKNTSQINIGIENSDCSISIRSFLNYYMFLVKGKTWTYFKKYNWVESDTIINEVIGRIKPNELVCCLNCEHFGFSGMSHDMSNGNSGYCNILLNEDIEFKGSEKTIHGIVSVTDYCSKFKAKNMDQNNTIKFYKVNEEYGCFSNFSKHPINIDGAIWPTSEHYFQAQKFINQEIQEEIRNIKSPMDAAIFGRRRDLNLRSDWETVKDTIMYNAVKAKILQHEEVQEKLECTKYKIIIEHTKNDSYWGDGGDGSGKNMLGKTLMRIRNELRNEKNDTSD